MPEARQQRQQDEPAHDILAAEAFAVPAADPKLGRRIVLPDDPAGILEPHDILAAEEFAMPAPDLRARAIEIRRARDRRRARWAAAGAVAVVVVWLRRRGR